MKIIIFGKNGQLGRSVSKSLGGWADVMAVCRKDVDLEDTTSVAAFIRDNKPDCIVNCAAFTSVDLAEERPDEVNRVNALSVKMMAHEAKKIDSLLVHFSTDYVFNGKKEGQYYETDPVSPINVYGKSKVASESYIRQMACRHLILRSGWLYGPGSANFPTRIIKRLNNGEKCPVVSDCFGAPTSTVCLAESLSEMLHILNSKADIESDLFGTYHLVSSGFTSWYKYAKLIFEEGKKSEVIKSGNLSDIFPVTMNTLNLAAPRPKNCRLNCDKIKNKFGISLPDWEESFKEYYCMKEN